MAELDELIACLQTARAGLEDELITECESVDVSPDDIATIAGRINDVNELLAFYKAKK
jgi:hypothetical protein